MITQNNVALIQVQDQPFCNSTLLLDANLQVAFPSTTTATYNLLFFVSEIQEWFKPMHCCAILPNKL